MEIFLPMMLYTYMNNYIAIHSHCVSLLPAVSVDHPATITPAFYALLCSGKAVMFLSFSYITLSINEYILKGMLRVASICHTLHVSPPLSATSGAVDSVE